MNARPDEPVEAVVVRSGQDPIVVNLDIAEASEFPVPLPSARWLITVKAISASE